MLSRLPLQNRPSVVYLYRMGDCSLLMHSQLKKVIKGLQKTNHCEQLLSATLHSKKNRKSLIKRKSKFGPDYMEVGAPR